MFIDDERRMMRFYKYEGEVAGPGVIPSNRKLCIPSREGRSHNIGWYLVRDVAISCGPVRYSFCIITWVKRTLDKIQATITKKLASKSFGVVMGMSSHRRSGKV